MRTLGVTDLTGAGAWALAFVLAAGMGAMGCSSSSSSDDAGVEPRAFEFTPETMMEAAWLAVDKLDLFVGGLSELSAGILGVVEEGEQSVDFSADLCEAGGTAVLNATQPLGAGSSAVLTLANCLDGDTSGTLSYNVQTYDAGATTPSPYLVANVELNLSGTDDLGGPEATTARFLLQAFRDETSIGFRYGDPAALWSLTEEGSTTKLACFDLNVFLQGENVILGDRRVGDTYAVVVSGDNRLFSVVGFGAGPDLVFGASGEDDYVVLNGSGLDFVSLVARSDCAAAGAPDGITPGNTSMALYPDPDVFGGIVLELDDGTTVNTTWMGILDD
jgi:hypothetical protein